MFSHQLISPNHPNNPTPNHPGVYSDRFPDLFLHLRGGIEAEDEVVARVELLLMFYDWFGEEEGTPICEGTDDASVLEEEGAGLKGNT